MELLLKTIFDEYELTNDEKLILTFYYYFGVQTYFNAHFIGDVNGIPVEQKYLLN